MKKLLSISLLLLLANFTVFAQPNRDWVNVSAGGGTGNDYTEAVFVDAAGNSYATGSFNGAITIGGDAHNSTGTTQCFIVKLNAAGVVQWSVVSSGDDKAYGHCIYVDDGGYVYVGGHHTQTSTTFGSLSATTNANEEPFIVKISPTGVPIGLLGADVFNSGKAQIWGITGNNDNVYITGFFKGNPIQFGGQTGLAPSQDDIWIAKIDSSLGPASCAWIQSHGGAGSGKEYGTDIAIDGNDLFVTGYADKQIAIIATGPDYIVPDYDNNSIWLLQCAENNGNTNWATHAGGPVMKSESRGIVLDGTSVYISGFVGDSCRFNQSQNKSGPWTYNDTIFSNGDFDAFVAKYAYNGNLQTVWSEGGTGDDRAWDIAYDPTCNEIEITGEFDAAFNFGGVDNLSPNGQDIFVSAYDQNGVYQWAFNETSSGNEFGKSIHANNGRTAFGGEFTANITFGTATPSPITAKGGSDYFVSSFQCANAAICGPTITCPPNDTVTADGSCNYVMTDYVGNETVVDGCLVGYSVTQDIAEFTVLPAGTHPITMTVTDNNSNVDQCVFNLVVEANVDPVLVNCGDTFINQTTGGSGNTASNFSCTSTSTPGQDVYYQVTVPTGNHFLYVDIDNVVDSNDDTLHAFWVGDACPLGASCVEADPYDVANQEFVNSNSNTSTFLAVGPGTFYFVVDAEVDSIQSYDISFYCLTSGIELDTNNCTGNDPDKDGIIPFVNGSSAILDVEPCETVQICHDLVINNLEDFEWLDSVVMDLGPCYENINLATLSPDNPPGNNGTYDPTGDWDATYNAGTNSLTWVFDHSTNPDWGDGNTGPYSCNVYNFCFDADITSGCVNNDSLSIDIFVWDDAIPVGNTVGGFDNGVSDDFNLINIADASWNYGGVSSWCPSDPSPTISGTTGGTFSSTAGLVWFDQPNGIIDLSASTVGNYNITYSVGLCPTDSIINIDITLSDDASFTYAATYCQGDTDPTANITGEVGGTFSGPVALVFLNPTTGLIDLSASTPGGPYTIKYVTTDPCKDSTTFDITINPTEDASFGYTTTSFCTSDADPSPSFITQPGGTFSEITGNINVNNSGVIDISTSSTGTYYVVHTTGGPCPDLDSVQVTITADDDPFFDYPQAAYCASDADPIATNVVTGGGTFSEVSGSVTFLNTTTGLIDLDASVAGGPYTIKYVTSGICPDSTTFDITINPDEDASFGYATTSFCTSSSDPSPSFITQPGGSFSEITGNISVNGSGTINISSSTPGTYYVVYTSGGPCPDLDSVQVTITADDDPFFDYPQAAYCASDADPIATNVVTGGGTFSEVSGSVTFLNTTTGLIDLDASVAGGPYTIKYVTSGICPDSTTFDITINPDEDASFGYATTSFCTSSSDPSPSFITQPGGSFSEITGNLDINGGSGTIDISGTIPGTYYAVYTSGGPCPDLDSVQVTITADDDPFFDYPQNTYCSYDTDPAATNIATGGGTFSEAGGSVTFLNTGTGLIDLDASTAGGPYTIKYVTAGICPDSTTFNITINQADDPFFDYPQNTYCSYDTDPAATNIATGGGTFTAPAGVTILNPMTGLIDLDASTAGGPYAIKYVTPGVCPDSTTFNITINQADDPFFDYPQNTYCSYDTDPAATNIATGGGTFSEASGSINFLNTGTGLIDLDASTAGGPYTIKYVTSGICPDSITFNITINQADDPFFDYPQNTYCSYDTDPAATNIATGGGTFTAPAAVTILNPLTGLIDLDASTAGGPYAIKYVTPGVCPDSTTFNITINQADDPFFDYPQNAYCSYDTDPAATNVATGGGTFSEAGGSVNFLNTGTGLIDLDASTAGGPYTIKYVTSGICPDSTTFNITINQADDPFFDYTQNAYCSYDTDPAATNIATGGGTFTAPAAVTILNPLTGLIDLDASTAGGPYAIKYVTPGVCPDSTTFNITINQADDPFFDYPQNAYCSYDTDPAATNIATGGGTFSETGGSVTFLNTGTGLIDLDASTAGGPYTIKYVTSGICPDSTTFNITINQADDPFFDYTQNAYCSYDTDPAATNIATGGGTFTAPAAVTILNPLTGLIDLDASTAGGPYAIKYVTPGVCPDSTTFNITINQADDPFFDYPQNSYCSYDTDPAATNVATGGGTFSEASSSVTFLNTGTGLIDLDASTPGGPYTIKYVTAGICPDSTTFNITINQGDDPFFDFQQTLYCQGDNDPAADNVATGGGTFYEASGSVTFLNTSTGLIDLDASTAGGPYTIKYVTAGICPDSATFNLTIVAEDIATFSYSSTSYCENDPDQMPTSTGTPGGTYTFSPGGLDLNNGDGEVEIDDSSVGNYTIYYTTSGTCPNIDSVDFDITAQDDPFFDYQQTAYCQGDFDPAASNVATGGGTFYEASGSIIFLNTGTGLIDLDASTAGGPYTIKYVTAGICPDSTTFDVTINAEDDPSFNYANTVFCNNDTNEDTIAVGTNGGMFTSNPGTIIIDGTSGEINVANSQPGVNQVYYTTAGICPSIDSVEITINAEDDASVSFLNPVLCNNDDNQDTLSVGTSGGSFTSSSTNLIVDGTSGEINVSGSQSGVYQIYYATNGICPNIDSIEITINAEDDPSFSYADTIFCNYDLDEDTLSVVMPGGSFSSSSADLAVNSVTGTVNVNVSNPGNFMVYYTSPGPDCPNTDSVNIIINAVDDPSFQFDSEYCETESNPTPSTVVAGGSFSSTDMGLVIDGSIGTIDLSNSAAGGNYEIQYLTSGICPDSTTNFVTIHEIPTVDAGPDQDLNYQFSTQLEGIFTGDYSQWTVVSGTGILVDFEDPQSFLENLSVGENSLILTASNGTCEDVEDVVLIKLSELWVPEVVTPNGDGKNDYFNVLGIENGTNHVQILNRWGQVVFETENYENDWQGYSNNGTMLEDETYFYIITVDALQFKGYVVLKR